MSAKTEGKRTAEFNPFKALVEASQALTWVAFLPGSGAPLPGTSCDEAWQSAEFWVNKVLMEFRGKDDKQVAWVTALKALFTALRALCGDALPIEVIDVDMHAELVERYDELVPVLVGVEEGHAPRQLCNYFLNENNVRSFLAA